MATLAVLGPGQAADAVHAHPVGALLVEPDRVEAHGHVGVGVLQALDLVEQLGGDGADRDQRRRCPGAW